jgi:Grx4 family monothiol glutaredoxin
MRATAAASPAIVAARAAPTRRATDAATAAKSFAASSDRARVLLGGRALAPRRRRARGASVASLSLDDDGDDDDGAPTRLDASRANRIKEMMASYAERHPSEADVTLEREKQKLTEEAPKAAAVSVFDDSPAGETLETRLKRLTTQSPVVLFMKGDRDAPRCGFSAKVVAAVNETGVAYSTFDILSSPEIREGLKEYSDWPTYPQLYANGELVGGCDIVLDMASGGTLTDALRGPSRDGATDDDLSGGGGGAAEEADELRRVLYTGPHTTASAW